MAKVVVEIDPNYAGVLTLTAIGTSVWETRVATTGIELSKCCHVSIGEDGKWVHHPMKDGDNNG